MVESLVAISRWLSQRCKSGSPMCRPTKGQDLMAEVREEVIQTARKVLQELKGKAGRLKGKSKPVSISEAFDFWGKGIGTCPSAR